MLRTCSPLKRGEHGFEYTRKGKLTWHRQNTLEWHRQSQRRKKTKTEGGNVKQAKTQEEIISFKNRTNNQSWSTTHSRTSNDDTHKLKLWYRSECLKAPFPNWFEIKSYLLHKLCRIFCCSVPHPKRNKNILANLGSWGFRRLGLHHK